MLTEASWPPVQLMRRLFRGLVFARRAQLERTRGGGRDVNLRFRLSESGFGGTYITNEYMYHCAGYMQRRS